MKFIAPLEIASKIMTLIVEAEKELILVSPYININDWDKMKNSLSKAVNKGVKITFITRANANNDYTPLKALKINPILIKDLHAKVYINEKYAIVTSQNIIHYSDINSIDLGYLTENESERNELIGFVNNYLTTTTSSKKLVINRIENFDYGYNVQIDSFQVSSLNNHFKKKYFDVKFVCTSNYVFSGQLLSFADVMISSIYTIKIEKSLKNINELIEKISNIDFDFKHKFRVDLRTSHKRFYYLEFVPTSRINFNNLLEDFVTITNSIIKNKL